MLPVVVGERETQKQILLYSALLFLISILPAFLQMLGPLYLLAALVLNGYFLYDAWDIWQDPTPLKTWRLYKYSLIYLALLFVVMGMDRVVFRA